MPTISYSLSADGIAITTSLDDYLLALADEIGNPAAILTKSQLISKLQAASIVVCEKIKKVTAQVK